MSDAKPKSAPLLSKESRGKFAAKIIKKAPDACWLWTGNVDAHGCGRIMLEGKAYRAHQLAWSLHNEQLPAPGQVIQSTCGCSTCCNPNHLRLVDRKEHNQQRIKRAKLTPQAVKEVTDARVEQAVADQPSIPRSQHQKAQKPYPDFPMFAHQGRWSKKVDGRIVSFGNCLEDWQEALDEYNLTIEAIRTGEPIEEYISIDYLVHETLVAKEGVVAPRTLKDYREMKDRILEFFGPSQDIESLTPADFKRFRDHLGKGVSGETLDKRLRDARVFFNWAYKGRIVKRPLEIGESLKERTKGQRRKDKRKRKYTFSVEELKAIYGFANPQMKCIILLALNAALGNKDIGTLRLLDLIRGRKWVSLVRSKTGVIRSCPLWPETQALLKKQIEKRNIKKPSELVFMSRWGNPLTNPEGLNDAISKEFKKLCEKANCHILNRGFYGLRHTFRNIAYKYCKGDREAVDFIFGHKEGDTADEHYLDPDTQIEDARLLAVSKVVRKAVKKVFTSLTAASR